MKDVVKVIKGGVEDTMPRSIWDQLPADKSGWSLLVKEPEEVKEVEETKEEPSNGEGKGYPTDSAANEDWTVEQLKEYAKDNSIELGKATKEAGIIKKIREAGH